ncbi:hypothetical protein ACHAW5_010526 [Stephanodiscus triporus]|uniref:Uncharacterized protein n=1 Tax=Stephanodiscus triporus TaxID=2934178 RepID=A0ABD3NXW3_9STRA
MSAAVSSSQAPDSPPIERRQRSSSFGSITPAFSSDLAKLRAACAAPGSVVRSYAEAIAIASKFDVLGPNSPLSRKLKLAGEGEWIEFIEKSGAVVVRSSDECGDENVIAINLEKLLRHCFDVAFKVPPSAALSTSRRNHQRSASGRVVLDARDKYLNGFT